MFVLKIFLVILVIGGLLGAIGLFRWSRKSKSSKLRNLSWAIALIGSVLAILFLFGLFKFADILAFVWVFNIFTDKLISFTGWNIWLIRTIALLPSALAIWVLSFIFSLKKERRQIGYSLLLGLAVLMCLGMFGLSRDTYFNSQTGEAQKWYAVTPEGYHFFDSPGFDPKYGTKRELVTTEVQGKINSQQIKPQQFNVLPDEKEVFFNVMTGEPCQWYYQADDGSYEFFSKPITHPKYGVPLEPVTKEVVKDWEAKKAKAESEMGELEKWLKDEEVKSSQLEEEKAALGKEKIELQNQVKQLQAEFARDAREKQGLEQILKVTRQEVDSLQTENISLMKSQGKVDEDKEVLQRKVYSLQEEIKELENKTKILQGKVMTGVLVNNRSQSVTFIFKRNGVDFYNGEVPAKDYVRSRLLPGEYDLVVEENGQIIHQEKCVINAIEGKEYYYIQRDFVIIVG